MKLDVLTLGEDVWLNDEDGTTRGRFHARGWFLYDLDGRLFECEDSLPASDWNTWGNFRRRVDSCFRFILKTEHCPERILEQARIAHELRGLALDVRYDAEMAEKEGWLGDDPGPGTIRVVAAHGHEAVHIDHNGLLIAYFAKREYMLKGRPPIKVRPHTTIEDWIVFKIQLRKFLNAEIPDPTFIPSWLR